MKNFNNRCYLQSFVTFALKTTAFVKFCMPAGRQEDISARPRNFNFFSTSLCLSGAKGDYHSTPGLLVIGYFPSLPMKGKTSIQGNVNFWGSLY
jgi:hypothetical protein